MTDTEKSQIKPVRINPIAFARINSPLSNLSLKLSFQLSWVEGHTRPPLTSLRTSAGLAASQGLHIPIKKQQGQADCISPPPCIKNDLRTQNGRIDLAVLFCLLDIARWNSRSDQPCQKHQSTMYSYSSCYLLYLSIAPAHEHCTVAVDLIIRGNSRRLLSTSDQNELHGENHVIIHKEAETIDLFNLFSWGTTNCPSRPRTIRSSLPIPVLIHA